MSEQTAANGNGLKVHSLSERISYVRKTLSMPLKQAAANKGIAPGTMGHWRTEYQKHSNAQATTFSTVQISTESHELIKAMAEKTGKSQKELVSEAVAAFAEEKATEFIASSMEVYKAAEALVKAVAADEYAKARADVENQLKTVLSARGSK